MVLGNALRLSFVRCFMFSATLCVSLFIRFLVVLATLCVYLLFGVLCFRQRSAFLFCSVYNVISNALRLSFCLVYIISNALRLFFLVGV